MKIIVTKGSAWQETEKKLFQKLNKILKQKVVEVKEIKKTS